MNAACLFMKKVLGNLVQTHVNLKPPGRKDSILNIVNKQMHS